MCIHLNHVLLYSSNYLGFVVDSVVVSWRDALLLAVLA